MAKQLPKRDLENVGLGVTGACVALVTLVVAALIFMVAQKGLSAFFKDGVSIVEFFTGTKWDLANTAENGLPYTGALPLIVTSFAVMVLSTLIALPIAIGSAIFAVEISPKFGSKIFQPLIELLTGIPSVVFGLIGFHVVVGLMKSVFHVSTGLGILPGAIVLAVMILPTMTTLSVDGLRAVRAENAAEAKKLLRGTIDFVHGCVGAKGDEKEDVLLVGDNMVNQTIPLILCAEEDVEGNHGASIGKLDENMLFYAATRGIPPEEAQRLLTLAKIEAINSQIPSEEVRGAVDTYLKEQCI